MSYNTKSSNVGVTMNQNEMEIKLVVVGDGAVG